MRSPVLPDAARTEILDWFASNRRSLPFRESADPWAILVSEAMAQQTQAARAGEGWTRFMTSYPTPAELAAASPGDVLRAWQGLGYNRRALNLRRAARRIVELHDGAVPRDLSALEALPGVGPYTARAVAAIAFGVPVGAVDTNVRRVLGRLVAGDPERLGAATLQAIADAATPAGRAGDWTHAVMDLGALVCRPRRPDCEHCPVRSRCAYAARRPAARTGSPEADESQQRRDRAQAKHARQPGGPPFPRTNRWLRGRIVDRLRTAAGDGWTTISGPIGSHDERAVAAALEALAREGLVELDASASAGGRRARLPLA